MCRPDPYHYLTTLLQKFSEHVGAKTYFDIYGHWWPGSMRKLETNILSAMNDAKTLRVNLDGLVKHMDEFSSVVQKGSRGIEPVAVMKGVERGNITNWEVYTIYTTENLRKKAKFYFKGKEVLVP